MAESLYEFVDQDEPLIYENRDGEELDFRFILLI
jgi:hypothetical protein